MADRPSNTSGQDPEGNEMIIDETIAYIDRTVSAKALEASLLIEGYILTNYVNDDLEPAFSKDSNREYQYHEMDAITSTSQMEDQDRFSNELTYEIDGLISIND